MRKKNKIVSLLRELRVSSKHKNKGKRVLKKIRIETYK